MLKRARQDSVSSESDHSPTPDLESVSSVSSPGATTADLGVSSAPPSKYAHLDDMEEASKPTQVISCSLSPHREPIPFSSYEEFEVHYAQAHVNRCSECRRNFPTEHFLQLHIGENHDPLNDVRKAKGEKIVRSLLIPLLHWTAADSTVSSMPALLKIVIGSAPPLKSGVCI